MSSSNETVPPDSPRAAADSPPPPPRFLVVDDDLINQRVMVNLLKRRGWTSAVAASGKACLEKTAGERFDLVLLDIQMPEMDGFTAATLLRRQESEAGRPRTPIVALTALRQPDTRERCLEAGMDDHLAKPVNTDQLYTVIERLLRL